MHSLSQAIECMVTTTPICCWCSSFLDSFLLPSPATPRRTTPSSSTTRVFLLRSVFDLRYIDGVINKVGIRYMLAPAIRQRLVYDSY